jgi:large subunit ribosomal protein L31e
MADKTNELERVYTIPLRKTKDLVRSRRAQLAVRDVKRFLTRHMKSEHIWIDNEVNELLWENGKYRIPSRIRVRATRFNDGVVEVTLPETEHAGSVRTEIQERREKAAEKTILKAPAAGEEEHVHEDDKPVTAIEGIGPATAEKLAKADIEHVSDLAKADAEELAKATGFSVEKLAPWIEEAKKLAPKEPETPEATPAEPAAESKATESAESTPATEASSESKPTESKGSEKKE